jgi:hypothetical protein
MTEQEIKQTLTNVMNEHITEMTLSSRSLPASSSSSFVEEAKVLLAMRIERARFVRDMIDRIKFEEP